MYVINSFNPHQCYEFNFVIIHPLQVKKLRHRGVPAQATQLVSGEVGI